MLSGRVADLEGRLATQGKLLAERDYENNQLRQANEGNDRIIKELRVEIAGLSGGKSSAAFESLRAEKTALEEQLRTARDERAKLQRDINAIQQQAESSWATERMENALLRERINDIAAEVAKLAMQLEGPNSPIEALLAAEAGQPPKPAPRPANDIRPARQDRGLSVGRSAGPAFGFWRRREIACRPGTCGRIRDRAPPGASERLAGGRDRRR